MKTPSQSQIFTRRQTLNLLALGAAGIATANAFAATRSDDNASVNTNPGKHKQSNYNMTLPFVISF